MKISKIVKKYLTWAEVEKLIKKIAKAILKAKGVTGAKYDMIVSIGRGGLVIARLVAEYLKVKKVQVVDVASYTEDNTQGQMYIDNGEEATKMFSAKLGGKNVLVVDDCVVTGDTLKVVKGFLKDKCGAANIDSAVLFLDKNNKHTNVSALGKSYNAKKNWIVFPWEELSLSK